MSESKFVISLDFELFWGVMDSKTIESYGAHVSNERLVIPRLLELFTKYGIGATWATVGILFCKNKDEIKLMKPKMEPSYDNIMLNPYLYIDKIGNDECDDPYHYGYKLIQDILHCQNQEFATHTFGHYYCLEPGQTIEEFKSDMDAIIHVADQHGVKFKSIVFPRNQYSLNYLQVCVDNGISVYRGNEHHWAYRTSNNNTKLKRIFRLLDSYINLSGHHHIYN